MIEENVCLKNLSHIQVGGNARYFLRSENIAELISELKKWRSNNPDKKIFVLGGGTNLLFCDEGFSGLVVAPQIKFIRQDGDLVEVGSGVSVAQLLNFLMEKSLSGLEWAGGLPGNIGGAIFGNAGAFGGETKDILVEVKSLDLNDFKIKSRSIQECEFAYRQSIFKNKLSQKEIILSAVFRLKPGNRDEIEEKTAQKVSYRKERQPLDMPNFGSTFKNVSLDKVPSEFQKKFHDKIKNDPFPLIPAAVFLSDAGLAGRRVGEAQISTKHPNFIVNLGDATCRDIKELINIVQDEIKKKFNIDLELEIIEVK